MSTSGTDDRQSKRAEKGKKTELPFSAGDFQLVMKAISHIYEFESWRRGSCFCLSDAPVARICSHLSAWLKIVE
uniref:SWIM-type domain-containing protein n=1 Tax=Romanomermis culicivorax TaxID=13658 RepID=A0A915JH44_ROMCU